MNACDALAQELLRYGTKRVFSHAGGTISRPLAAIAALGVDVAVMVSEAQAVHAAQGAYRVSGRTQVAIVTSGPGVTNAVTGVSDAYYDADAVLLVCGQVSRSEMNPRVRQSGFQELPTVRLMQPICKAAVLLDFAPDVGPTVAGGLALAAAPRPGPVVLDFPMDVQRGEAAHPDGGISKLSDIAKQPKPQQHRVYEVVQRFLAAKNPLVIAGRGCLSATFELASFTNAHKLQVVTSLPAVGAIPSHWPQCLGFLGHTGHEEANREVAEADALLVLGARLDVRQTGTMVTKWAEGKYIVSVDYDQNELSNRRVHVDAEFNCSVKEFLACLIGDKHELLENYFSQASG